MVNVISLPSAARVNLEGVGDILPLTNFLLLPYMRWLLCPRLFEKNGKLGEKSFYFS